MPPLPTVTDPTFREYAELQLRRHQLLAEGKADASETGQVEDRMGELWEKLDSAQRRSANGMGSDLNWVRRKGAPPPKGRKAEEVTEEDRRRLVEAEASGDWSEVLHLLRACAPVMEPKDLALRRAKAYAGMGLRTYEDECRALAAGALTAVAPLPVAVAIPLAVAIPQAARPESELPSRREVAWGLVLHAGAGLLMFVVILAATLGLDHLSGLAVRHGYIDEHIARLFRFITVATIVLDVALVALYLLGTAWRFFREYLPARKDDEALALAQAAREAADDVIWRFFAPVGLSVRIVAVLLASLVTPITARGSGNDAGGGTGTRGMKDSIASLIKAFIDKR